MKLKFKKRIFKILSRTLFLHYRDFIFFCLLIPLHMFLGSFIPRFLGQIIDLFFNKSESFEILNLLGLIFLLMCFKVVFLYISRYQVMKISRRVEYYLRSASFLQILHVDKTNFQKEYSGKILLQLTSEIEKIRFFFAQGFNLGLNLIFLSLFVSLQMIFLDAYLAFLVIIPTALAILFVKKLSFRLHLATKNFQKYLDQLIFFSSESFHSLYLFRFLSFKKIFFDFQEKTSLCIPSYTKLVLLNNLIQNIFFLIIKISLIGVLILGYQKIIKNEMTIGTLLSFIRYMDMIFPALFFLKSISRSFYEAWLSFERISDLLEQKKRSAKSRKNFNILAKTPLIQLRNLNFSYKHKDFQKEHEIFKDIHLKINPGDRIGILGDVGSGKTSLLHCIMGFYDSIKDDIQVNFMSLKKFQKKNTLNPMFFPEEVYIFPETVLWNIRFGAKIPLKTIYEATQNAEIHKDIMKFPDQYKQKIGPGYRSLSAGQKQRVALSRIFCRKNTRLVLLDNPFSNLDIYTEKKILNNIDKLYPNTSIIITSPKVQNTGFFNHFYLLEDKKVKELSL